MVGVVQSDPGHRQDLPRSVRWGEGEGEGEGEGGHMGAAQQWILLLIYQCFFMDKIGQHATHHTHVKSRVPRGNLIRNNTPRRDGAKEVGSAIFSSKQIANITTVTII